MLTRDPTLQDLTVVEREQNAPDATQKAAYHRLRFRLATLTVES
jgi:hypothetical protein